MRKLLLLVAAVAVAVGCGGNGENPAVYPYTGTWEGTWDSPAMEQNGEATFLVGPTGHVTGQIMNTAIDMEADVEGTLAADGTVSGTVTYPDQEPTAITGNVSLNAQGHLVGTLSQNFGEASVDLNLDVVRQ